MKQLTKILTNLMFLPSFRLDNPPSLCEKELYLASKLSLGSQVKRVVLWQLRRMLVALTNPTEERGNQKAHFLQLEKRTPRKF